MGMSSASTLTTKMIAHFKPKFTIMVGIAAGIGGGKNYGDIIIPSEIWNYSGGKYVSNDENNLLAFIPDPKNIQLDPKLREQFSQDFSHILFEIKKNWDNHPLYDLKIISGPLACGSAVVANTDIVKTLITNHSRKTVGLDMESYGVFYATLNSYGEKVLPICIKSICDFADAGKSDDHQKYAAYTSAMFMKYFIENHLDL